MTEMALPERVAVSGGAGFIGSHTVELLVGQRCRVMVIDDLSHACPWQPPPGVELVVADCGSEEAARALANFRPEAVLHLAARGGVQRARRDPAAHVRAAVASTVGFFQSAVAAGARRIVTASSGGATYGRPPRLPASERMRPAPLSAYGASKVAEEVYLACTGREYGISTMALRYGNVYGERQDGTGEAGLVAITCNRLVTGTAPVINGDGQQTRDFIHVSDVAAANLAALASRRSGVVNVGTGQETSVGQVVAALVRLAGFPGKPSHASALPGEVRRVCLDTARARRWLGWTPRMSLDRGLRCTFAYFQSALADSSRFRELDRCE
ncbi:MAG TPA: NAD-dependent epimerase/dehydratase family protein [Candidatus Dormibacteraeota bacterium]|nr:NAD-dependent epimerase/dehydratase family protein [Candidatus Dormibacteraeota bacterium]